MKALRADAGLTQAELADRLGVARQTISSIEGGKYEPSLGLGMRIARLLGARVEETFFLDEPEGG